MSDEGLYTELMREQRWLSNHLQGRPEVRRLLQDIRAARALEDLAVIRAGLEESLTSIRPEYPRLGRLEAARVDEYGGDDRRVNDSARIPTTRYWVKLPVAGDLEMLRYWPDRSTRQLKSVHHELMERIGGYQNLARASDADAQEYWRLQPMWRLGPVDRDGGPWALYTYVDLTRDEERDLAATGGLASAVEERCERISAIVEEIAVQAKEYFEVELPARAQALVDGRREVIADRTELLKDLAVPTEWSGEQLELEEVVATTPMEASAEPTEHDDTAKSTPHHAEVSLDLREMRYRLSPKSFADVLRTIRTWADAVEQNPRGFGHLDEDSVSDLLAATLNATVPHAGREVFSRSGKVDIHLTANVLAEGTGPAEVFLCESKWASTREDVREALEDQIFRYLTARSTQAVLLALCRHQDFSVGENSVRQWAAEASGFLRTSDGPVAAWPHHAYDVDGRTVEVCIATVAIPRVTTRAGKPK